MIFQLCRAPHCMHGVQPSAPPEGEEGCSKRHLPSICFQRCVWRHLCCEVLGGFKGSPSRATNCLLNSWFASACMWNAFQKSLYCSAASGSSVSMACVLLSTCDMSYVSQNKKTCQNVVVSQSSGEQNLFRTASPPTQGNNTAPVTAQACTGTGCRCGGAGISWKPPTWFRSS